jgi:hypothetical protein
LIKNNGLILFSTFGPNTLKELKKSWAVVDNKPHVNTFADMHHTDGLFLSDSCAKSKQIIFEFGKRCNKDWDNKPVPAPKSKTTSA